jgi:hypothetical protein
VSAAWRARIVTVGLVGTLIVTGTSGAELWPFSSFRLFSEARDGEIWGTRLAAVARDGHEEPVVVDGHPTPRAARQRLRAIVRHPPERQREDVLAWLQVTGMDASRYRSVRIYEVLLRIPTDQGPREVVRRELRAEVFL